MNLHDVSKTFECNVCWSVFECKSKLILHYRTHTGEKPFACQTCDKKFSRKHHLERHQATHSDVRPFKCPICPDGRSFKTKDGLNNHLSFHYKPKYSCHFCDHKSYSKGALNRHIKTHLKDN